MVFTSLEFLQQLKEDFTALESAELRFHADALMDKGPFSVTYNKSPHSHDIHDYYSEGPYWWPDPENPEGPYIRRDGITYPDRFNCHHADMAEMADASIFLAAAGFLLDSSAYRERAALLINVWFSDEETFMRPHLEYAQAIPGICSGRSFGIIDTVCLLKVVYAADILEAAGYDMAPLRAWFADYTKWLNTSENGLEEKMYINNHANWWNTQAAAFASFCGNKDMVRECCDDFLSRLLPTQMADDGGFTCELGRTKSYSYSLFSLSASVLLCEIAYHQGIDIWNAKSDGKSVELGIDFMLPYLENQFLWPHKQIQDNFTGSHICLQLGAVRLGRPDYRDINLKRGASRRITSAGSEAGPLFLFPR